jgi:hypothetical protein
VRFIIPFFIIHPPFTFNMDLMKLFIAGHALQSRGRDEVRLHFSCVHQVNGKCLLILLCFKTDFLRINQCYGVHVFALCFTTIALFSVQINLSSFSFTIGYSIV